MHQYFGAITIVIVIMARGTSFGADRCDFSEYKPLRIGVSEGKTIIGRAVPEYPSEAINRQIEGLVSVRVLYDDNGVVLKACVTSGHRLLRDASVSAALKTIFSPVLLNGKAVPHVEQQISFNFVLQKKIDGLPVTDVDYCELVRDKKYDGNVVRVRGIFTTDFEASLFESSDCPVPKDMNIPKTWIDFDSSYDRLTEKKWKHAIEKMRWRKPVEVIFIGRYEKKRDAPSYSGQGFGHMDMYLSRILLMKVEYVGRLPRRSKEDF
jgi:hypothetical protein